MVEYKTLRNCVEKLKEVNVNKSNRKKIISKISSPSDLEVEISKLELKRDILMIGGGGLLTLVGGYFIFNSSSDNLSKITACVTAYPAAVFLVGVVSAIEDSFKSLRNYYNSYINGPNLIQ